MDKQYIESSFLTEASSFVATDEVGRGCLAGPVTVASIRLANVSPAQLDYLRNLGVGDSKKITSKKRQKIIEALGVKLEEIFAGGSFYIKNDIFNMDLKIVHIDPNIIDEINILQATFLGMLTSANSLLQENDMWLIDGNQKPKSEHGLVKTIIQGDSKSVLIGLASIFAKEARDFLMNKLHLEFNMYDWDSNAGYGTAKHLLAIKQYGYCIHHRKSFSVDLSKIK